MSTMLPLAILALVPVMIGPLPAGDDGSSLTAVLCNGGTIEIPLGDNDQPAPADCHPKGCHAGTCRGKGDPRGPKRTI
jgi:hypothetical protein